MSASSALSYLGESPDTPVLSYRIEGENAVILLDKGKAGIPKHIIPLTELTFTAVSLPISEWHTNTLRKHVKGLGLWEKGMKREEMVAIVQAGIADEEE